MKTIVIVIVSIFFLNPGWSQNDKKNLIPLIGDNAPSFIAESTKGTIHFPGDFKNKWKILFAHPKDFTPVCSSEILELAYEQTNFENIGASLIIISTDDLKTHFTWTEALEKISYKDRSPVKIGFPLVEDKDYKISDLYGMTHLNASRGKNIRGVFFVDPYNKIRAFYFYPSEVGRNIEEIKRTLLALQKADEDINVAIPANWQPGDAVMVTFPTPLMVEFMKLPNSLYYQYSWFMTFRKDRE